jgi:uncharacterized protein (DUF4213/DUF364 family)
MSNTEAELWEKIVAGAHAGAAALPPEAQTIVAAWNTEYAAKLRDGSSPLHLKHVCVQTNHIGTCYYERDAPPPVIDELVLNSNVEKAYLSRYMHIAALDALYGNLIREPDQRYVLTGTASEKALERARIVCDEVDRVAHRIGQRDPIRIVNVGVVGDFLEILVANSRYSVEATDFYNAVIGRPIHGVRVQDGRNNFSARCVARADVAVVTGMTLANDTIDPIFAAAREHGTGLILFAETGANFAEIYLEAGAACVISEGFPFYLSGSPECDVRVYRAN